jgi:two-component sensor histidine kinase
VSALALDLDLTIPPEWSRIDPTREAVGLLVQAMFGDDDLRDALAMVSEELLENAIKYSAPGHGVRLSIRHDRDRVTVEVSNMVDEAAGHANVLRERVEWLRGFPDAAAAYREAIGRVYARQKRVDGEAGLGIVRIAYEGRADVTCALDGGRLTVRAEMTVGA